MMVGALGVASASFALAVGPASGRRAVAIAVAGGLAVLAFIVNAVGSDGRLAATRCGRSRPSAGTRTPACSRGGLHR